MVLLACFQESDKALRLGRRQGVAGVSPRRPRGAARVFTRPALTSLAADAMGDVRTRTVHRVRVCDRLNCAIDTKMV
jgi:predicted RNA-binding Zn ribbon-like protein